MNFKTTLLVAIKVGGGGGNFALFFRLLDRCVIRKYESHSTKHFSFISGISRYQKAKGEQLYMIGTVLNTSGKVTLGPHNGEGRQCRSH